VGILVQSGRERAMAHVNPLRPLHFYRALLGLAAWIVPGDSRAIRLARWLGDLDGLWILVDRGELPASGLPASAELCRSAFGAAWRSRFEFSFDWRRCARGPAFLALALVAGFLLAAGVSHGFSATRTLFAVVAGAAPAGARKLLGMRPENALVAHLLPVILAVVAAVVLTALDRPSLRGLTWRGWLLLAGKLAAAALLVPALWIEGGAALRTCPAPLVLRLLIGGPVLALVFVAGLARGVWWCFHDQRRRCPICQCRLVMPVSIGNRAGTFEPATTELVCEYGHGALAASETQLGPPDRWNAFDSSWATLFVDQ